MFLGSVRHIEQGVCSLGASVVACEGSAAVCVCVSVCKCVCVCTIMHKGDNLSQLLMLLAHVMCEQNYVDKRHFKRHT